MSEILLRRAGSSPMQLMETIAASGFQCSHLTFFGQIRKHRGGPLKHFGPVELPEVWKKRTTLSFEEMASLVASVPGTYGYPGWVDLLCWKMVESKGAPR